MFWGSSEKPTIYPVSSNEAMMVSKMCLMGRDQGELRGRKNAFYLIIHSFIHFVQ